MAEYFLSLLLMYRPICTPSRHWREDNLAFVLFWEGLERRMSHLCSSGESVVGCSVSWSRCDWCLRRELPRTGAHVAGAVVGVGVGVEGRFLGPREGGSASAFASWSPCWSWDRMTLLQMVVE